MDFDEYQRLAARTGFTGDEDRKYVLMYLSMGIAGEAGEVVEKMKHVVRDADGAITPERLDLLKKEIGDVVWYLSQLARAIGLSFDDIAKTNLDKLQDRAARGVIKSEGDER